MIYLDNAATSFPKPPEVWAEQARCMREYCGNPGRGAHRLSMMAAEKIYACREALCEAFGCRQPERVIFTMNTTMSLNLAIKGLLRTGDHVLISDLEHNAVWRPICHLAQEGRIRYDVFPSFAASPTRTPEQICRGIEALLLPNTKMLVCTHASNICSVTMPLAEIGALCRRHGILFVVDAAQSAGHLSIDMERMQIDALCLPAHKGLFGVQGCGCLLLGESVCAEPLLHGGSGVHSLDPDMPLEAPERYEAGTLPTPAIAGLLEGIKFIDRVGLNEIHQKETALCRSLIERLFSCSSLVVHLPWALGSTVLFHSLRHPSEQIASELDHSGICVRSGFHCAALAHKTLRTPESGAVRISLSYFNSLSDLDSLWHVVKALEER